MTPRRLIRLLVAVIVSVGAFVAYDLVLGWIDGLPPLPPQFLEHRDSSAIPFSTFEAPNTPVARRLSQAFGPNCVELTYPIQFVIPDRGIVLAAGEMTPKDGLAVLSPLSLVVYGKSATPGALPTEFSTIHCDRAYVTFEKPIRSLSDMMRYRIVAADLLSDTEVIDDDRKGNVHVIHHREPPGAKPGEGEEYLLRTPGPVYYREAPPEAAGGPEKPQITTATAVEMVQRRGDGPPSVVTATGMHVYLVHETTDKTKPKHDNSTGYNGVKHVDLLSDVTMHLWESSNSGFLANGPAGKPQPARVSVVITTMGPFHYDLPTDVARFDILPQAPPNLRNLVEVDRETPTAVPGQALHDRLYCDFLELQFKRKPVEPAKPDPPKPQTAAADPQKQGDDREIERAHAWGRRVTISSDAEELYAHGTDLVYEAATRQTTLRGEPEMTAVKDGKVLYAPELVLFSQTADSEASKAAADGLPGGVVPPEVRDAERSVPKARAKGPGRICALDRVTNRTTQTATWQTELILNSEGRFDVLRLIGAATFEDLEQKQRLQGDELRVWLRDNEPFDAPRPAAQAGKQPGAKSGADSGRTKPHKLLALGKVEVVSSTLHVHDADQLTVWFADAPGLAKVAPPPAPALQPGPVASGPPPAAQPPTAKPAEPARKPAPPFDVVARTVEMYVWNTGSAYELDRVTCVDDVTVHQDPETPGDGATDLCGRRMVLTHYPGTDLHQLIAYGTALRPAEVKMPRLAILGPEITIDQKDNLAIVIGAGSLTMLSASDFQGNVKARPTPMTIIWTRDMWFQSQRARFTGNVQGEQDQSRVQCWEMQVFLDRPVSFSQLKTPDQPPKVTARPMTPTQPGAVVAAEEPAPAQVDKVICDSAGGRMPVVITKKNFEGGKLIDASRLESPLVSLDNGAKTMDAVGPGRLFILQRGNNDPTSPAGAPAPSRPTPANPRDEVLKLTRVRFQSMMRANDVKRIVTFTGDVEVLHLPSETMDVEIDLDKLPPDALTLRGDEVVVYTHRVSDAQSFHEMIATGRVTVRTEDMNGRADRVKYDEEQHSITLVGTEGNPAQVYSRKKGQRNSPMSAVKGTTLRYFLDSGNVDGSGIRGINGNQ